MKIKKEERRRGRQIGQENMTKCQCFFLRKYQCWLKSIHNPYQRGGPESKSQQHQQENINNRKMK